MPFAHAVGAFELPRLVAEVKAVQEELIRNRLALLTLVREINCRGGIAPETQEAVSFLRGASLPMITGCVGYEDWNKREGTLRWQAALANLTEDADAALPF